MNLKDLQKVIPEQWKIQTGKPGQPKGSVVAYIDARDVMKLLDEVVGPENWKDEYAVLASGDVKCRLSIKVGDDWIGKEDVGSQSDMEAEKGAFSDAFKRAGVKWGVGRFLYDLEVKWVDLDPNGKPIDKQGKRIYDMTAYIKGLTPTHQVVPPAPLQEKAQTPVEPQVVGHWSETVVHFGKNQGKKLGELQPSSVAWYAKNWQPREPASLQDVALRSALDNFSAENAQ